MKSVTTTLTGVLDTTGGVQLLNGLAQGSDFTNRIGRKLLMKALYIRLQIVPAATPTSQTNRVLIVYDRQTNGADPLITAVLDSANPAALMNLNNRERFRVIWDYSFATAVNGQTTKLVKKFIRFKRGLDVQYQGTTAAVADVTTGGLFCVTTGNQTAVSTLANLVTGSQVRIRFEDS